MTGSCQVRSKDMRLIDADRLKAQFREKCKTCNINGTKHCNGVCVVNIVCDRVDIQPTEERIIIYDK